MIMSTVSVQIPCASNALEKTAKLATKNHSAPRPLRLHNLVDDCGRGGKAAQDVTCHRW